MIDATFVEAPRQRNTREKNATIIAGEIPEGWDDPKQAAKRRLKDTDAGTLAVRMGADRSSTSTTCPGMG
jgi:hypothetical protein